MSERVLVTGGRDYGDRQALWAALDFRHRLIGISCVIQGECPTGADKIAREWARENGVECVGFPADWEQHGLAAGPIRNRQMYVEGKPDTVLATDGGNGTRGTVRLGERYGVRILHVPSDSPS